MIDQARPRQVACFTEAEPELPLARRAFAEGVGTLLLAIALTAALSATGRQERVVGAGLGMAATLTALIVALGPVSGGHFNPLITALLWARGERSSKCLIAYLAAQVAGAVIGGLIGNPAFQATGAAHHPATTSFGNLQVVAELVATSGLMIVVMGVKEAAPPTVGPFAAGAWVAMINLLLPSGALANPALAIAASLAGGGSKGGGAIASYLLFEIVGGGIALAVISTAYPRRRRPRPVRVSAHAPSAAMPRGLRTAVPTKKQTFEG